MKLFTHKESRVFFLVVQGFSNEEIALELKCKVENVKWHLTKIFKMCGVKSRHKIIAGFYRGEFQKMYVIPPGFVRLLPHNFAAVNELFKDPLVKNRWKQLDDKSGD